MHPCLSHSLFSLLPSTLSPPLFLIIHFYSAFLYRLALPICLSILLKLFLSSFFYVQFVFVMPKASGPGPQMISTRPHRSWPLIREAVCRNMKSSIELAVKPYYPAKIRQQIFFPDRKLVQFDSGKLQTLSNLLRQMKAGGHKCLIFTQMSKMLDILEVFLNLHAHTYVRLDGSTGTYIHNTYTSITLKLLLLQSQWTLSALTLMNTVHPAMHCHLFYLLITFIQMLNFFTLFEYTHINSFILSVFNHLIVYLFLRN